MKKSLFIFALLAIAVAVPGYADERREVPMLVSGLSPETDLLWEGRMPTQAPEIDGVTLINDFEGSEPQPGQIRRLRITEAHDYDVVGTLLPGSDTGPSEVMTRLTQITTLSPASRPQFPAL